MKKIYLKKSLSKSLIASSIIFMVIPLLLLGAGVGIYQYHSINQHQQENCFHVMEKILENIGDYWLEIKELKEECLTNYAIQKIEAGRADAMDYIKGKEILKKLSKNDNFYENISIVKNGETVLQTGSFYEDIDIQNEVMEYFAENPEVNEKWISPSALEHEFYLYYAYDGPLLTYCALLRDYTSKNYSNTGSLYVTIKEETLCSSYSDFMSDENTESYLTDQDGYILSAQDKESLGKNLEKIKNITFIENDTVEGKCSEDGKIYLYKHGKETGGYLVTAIPFWTYYQNIIIVTVLIAAAIILCIIFTLIFMLRMRKSVVLPIYELADKFRNMENGRLEVADFQEREDEIGVLQSSFNIMIMKLKKLIEQTLVLELQKKEAQIQSLTAQINPHFLYNTLDSIQWKAIRNKDREVSEQILALSDVYRYTLSKGEEFITLQEEMRFQKKYLYLMQMRFGERLQYELFMEKDLEMLKIPKLILQPLLENAIVHGIEPKVDGGKIKVEISNQKKKLQIRVIDNGIGFPEDVCICNEEIENLSFGFAIKNIQMRLKLYYKDFYIYRIQSKKNGGCTVEIVIDLEEMRKLE